MWHIFNLKMIVLFNAPSLLHMRPFGHSPTQYRPSCCLHFWPDIDWPEMSCRFVTNIGSWKSIGLFFGFRWIFWLHLHANFVYLLQPLSMFSFWFVLRVHRISSHYITWWVVIWIYTREILKILDCFCLRRTATTSILKSHFTCMCISVLPILIFGFWFRILKLFVWNLYVSYSYCFYAYEKKINFQYT